MGGTPATLQALKTRHTLRKKMKVVATTTKRGEGQRAWILQVAKTNWPNGEQFTTEQLTMACWRSAPKMFGLAGFENESANNKKVECILYGKHGLIARAKLIRVGSKLQYIGDGYVRAPKSAGAVD